MAREEPQVRLDVEFGPHLPLAVRAAALGDVGDAVEHQHRRQRQLRIAWAEEFPAAAGEQIFVLEAMPPGVHWRRFPA